MSSYSFGKKGAIGAIRNSLRLSDDIRQRFLSLEELWRSHISVHSQITGQAWPSTHQMHSFRKVSARISAGGFCSVEIWVLWMDDFYEVEFYSSWIKLALLQGSGYFLYEWWILRWLWNSRLVYPPPQPPFSLFWGIACYEMDFFSVIWQECLWLDFQEWCKSPKPFVPVPSKPNHILALECLYTQVYGETFKQQWVGTDCLGFGLLLLWWLILSPILIIQCVSTSQLVVRFVHFDVQTRK